jgi:Spy/CpxP family protein refolding chaperone
MRPILLTVLVISGLLGGAAALPVMRAEEVTPAASHRHGGDAVASPASGSPYADRDDPAAAIRSLTPEVIASIERGEGAGFALPAELNGVPGPRHVLDLAHEIGLSHEQRSRVRQIFDGMRAAVIPAGQRYLTAVRSLEEEFRSGTLAQEMLPDRVAEVYRLEGELAALHLVAHLQTAQVLTPEQIATYQRLRGYDTASGFDLSAPPLPHP